MFQFAEVGGAVRDSLLGHNSKDVDFVAIPTHSFDNADVAFTALENNLSELGFVSRSQISESGKTVIKGLRFSTMISAGITYPLDYFTAFYLGAEWGFGLNNLSKSTDFVDAFGNKQPLPAQARQ